MFFDLVSELILKLCNAESLPFNFSTEFHLFKASEVHNIPLFSEQFLKKIKVCKLLSFVQLYFVQFSSWFDNSLIKELVSASKSELAIELVDKFNTLLDYNLPITSYPIPFPSQLIMPLYDSDYTVVATKHTQNLKETTLRQIKAIKMLLISKWQITQHAIQLIALCATSNYLYWLIPKRVAHLITQCRLEVQEKLMEEGIIMINLFPSTCIDFSDDDDDLIAHNLSMGPFSFFSSCLQGKNMMVMQCVLCMKSRYKYVGISKGFRGTHTPYFNLIKSNR